ncbi:MAG: SDR family NAD(P)-dependent oxidoreductase [Pseudomonadota bacterium]
MPTVVITGAGSGLGRALAIEWAQRGWRIVATDRHLDGAQETVRLLPTRATGDEQHEAFVLDVTRDEDFSRLLNHMGTVRVDMLVNNAGVATAGSLSNTPLSEWDRVLDINLMGVVRGCRAFESRLRADGGGHVVNVASFAGLANAPIMATYNVTKAGVIALSETLRTEWLADKIGVTVVCPSFFQTGLLDHSESFGIDLKRIGSKLMANSPITAEDVARRVVADAEAKRFMCIPHSDARWLHRLKRLAPEMFSRMMVNKSKGMSRPREPSAAE